MLVAKTGEAVGIVKRSWAPGSVPEDGQPQTSPAPGLAERGLQGGLPRTGETSFTTHPIRAALLMSRPERNDHMSPKAAKLLA